MTRPMTKQDFFLARSAIGNSARPRESNRSGRATRFTKPVAYRTERNSKSMEPQA